MKKILGILSLLVAVSVATALLNPQFLSAYNLQNVVRWTALFGILSLGAMFVIAAGGIDLSSGSVVGLTGCLLPWLMTVRGWSTAAAVAATLLVAAGIGVAHGVLITRLKLQPFVVTLCGLLLYRGIARWFTGDQTLGFGSAHDGLRSIAIGQPCTLATLGLLLGIATFIVALLRRRIERREQWSATETRTTRFVLRAAAAVAIASGLVLGTRLEPFVSVRAPAPFVLLLGLALASHLFLERTVGGRHLLALGRNELAARYSGIDTTRLTIVAYVLSATLSGIGGILFALDVNSIQPALHGSFYELYAIAAAVLGGCSLRGGEASVAGVLIGAAVMRVLYNSINLLRIPTQLEPAIIGAVLLAGVVSDELVRRAVVRRRKAPPVGSGGRER